MSPICLTNCTTDVGANGTPMSGLLGEAVPSIDVCCEETTCVVTDTADGCALAPAGRTDIEMNCATEYVC